MTEEQTTDSCVSMELKLRKAADAYYNGAPIMTDAEYDELWRTHTESRQANPDDPLWEHTILDDVGAAPDGMSGFVKVTHRSPMESLDNVFVQDGNDIGEVLDWLHNLVVTHDLSRDHKLLAEPKIDGLSLRVSYKDGLLDSAVTRGNGLVGDDVTRNVKALNMIPPVLSGQHDGYLELNCEVYMSYGVFNRIVAECKESGEEPPANPRNAAAGILRRKDPRQVAGTGLELFVHGVADGAEEDGYDFERNRLANLGLPVPNGYPLTANSKVDDLGTKISYQWLRDVIDGEEYPIDGVVLKVTGYNTRRS
jgi:DNA ligase (NAD+)